MELLQLALRRTLNIHRQPPREPAKEQGFGLAVGE
jgi:hypothetical protein